MMNSDFDGCPVRTPVGYFTYTVRDDHWSWSDGLYALHGYANGAVDATTELLLSHKHPDDALRAYEILETAVTDGGPFNCYHRIVDAKGEVRFVLSVGRGVKGADGRVEQVTGFFVDLTHVRAREISDAAVRAETDLAIGRFWRRGTEPRRVDWARWSPRGSWPGTKSWRSATRTSTASRCRA